MRRLADKPPSGPIRDATVRDLILIMASEDDDPAGPEFESGGAPRPTRPRGAFLPFSVAAPLGEGESQHDFVYEAIGRVPRKLGKRSPILYQIDPPHPLRNSKSYR